MVWIGQWRHGDALKQLKTIRSNSIDCVITSPPYNFKSKGGDIKIKYNTYDDNVENSDYEKNQIEVINELYRVLKPEGHLFYNHKPRYEKGQHIHPLKWITQTKMNFFQEIIWKTNRRVDNGGFRFTPQTERIYWLKKDINNKNKLSKAFIVSDLWELGRSESFNEHPAPFPLSLPQRILSALYGDREHKHNIVVLDPYSGSGTVAKACMYMGMTSINIDMDKKYIKMGKERLDLNEMSNWRKEQENYVVKKPYKKGDK